MIVGRLLYAHEEAVSILCYPVRPRRNNGDFLVHRVPLAEASSESGVQDVI